MEHLVLSDRFNETALIRINRCQIKKQVLTMAEIIADDAMIGSIYRGMHMLTSQG